jgi:iron complex transport system permease protein
MRKVALNDCRPALTSLFWKNVIRPWLGKSKAKGGSFGLSFSSQSSAISAPPDLSYASYRAAFAASSRRRHQVLAGLGVLTFLLFILSVMTGEAALPWMGFLTDRGLGAGALGAGDVPWLILTEIRLPRAILGLTVGASLGLSGAVLQGFLRNPLADAGLVGASSTAALGAVIMLYFGVDFGLAQGFAWALPLGGMIGAGLAVILIYLLSWRDSSVFTLILAGVAINSTAAALTALALNYAPSPYAALEIVFWLLGSLSDRSFDQVWISLPFILVGSFLLLQTGRALDALSLGEDAARSLGFDMGRVRWLVIVGTALTVGAAVSVAGVIGFVGLVVPHLLRPLVGHRPGVLLAASALGGAALLLASDIAVRLLASGQELKLGVVTSLIGGPFFVVLLLNSRRRVA